VAAVRSDAIMATGRSDYPNQVNNVLGFPYIFRGALDVRATTINDEMKLAAAQALAALAREDVPDEVAAAYQGNRPRFGARYIIPVPFDPRLITAIPPAVAEAPSAPEWRGARSRTWTPTATSSRRGAIPSPAHCSRSPRGCAAGRSASSSPKARRSR
jgi:malic enzyme